MTSSNENTTVTSNVPSTILLKTAKTVASSANKKLMARIFLDEGSLRSYVCTAFANELNLAPATYDILNVHGFVENLLSNTTLFHQMSHLFQDQFVSKSPLSTENSDFLHSYHQKIEFCYGSYYAPPPTMENRPSNATHFLLSPCNARRHTQENQHRLSRRPKSNN